MRSAIWSSRNASVQALRQGAISNRAFEAHHGTFSSCAGSVAFAGRDGSTGCCIPWYAE